MIGNYIYGSHAVLMVYDVTNQQVSRMQSRRQSRLSRGSAPAPSNPRSRRSLPRAPAPACAPAAWPARGASERALRLRRASRTWRIGTRWSRPLSRTSSFLSWCAAQRAALQQASLHRGRGATRQLSRSAQALIANKSDLTHMRTVRPEQHNSFADQNEMFRHRPALLSWLRVSLRSKAAFPALRPARSTGAPPAPQLHPLRKVGRQRAQLLLQNSC